MVALFGVFHVLAKWTYMAELRGRQAGQLLGRQPTRDAKTSSELSEILYRYTHVSKTINFFRVPRKVRQSCPTPKIVKMSVLRGENLLIFPGLQIVSLAVAPTYLVRPC
jgi:hypothetical protein